MLEADTLARDDEDSPDPDDLTGGVAVVIMVSIVEPGHEAGKRLWNLRNRNLGQYLSRQCQVSSGKSSSDLRRGSEQS